LIDLEKEGYAEEPLIMISQVGMSGRARIMPIRNPTRNKKFTLTSIHGYLWIF